ncbi:MAG: IS607 family transposase [Cyanothece sp. SIO2G6]|nr:IS607 family transposase [Cyanothece sp. SIO2G6]
MSKISVTEAAKLLGVTTKTLYRWEQEGKLVPERTKGGHRRYDVAQVLGLEHGERKTIAYGRVSSHDQKADLERQVQVLEAFCGSHGWTFEVIRDLGSGMNYRKKGLVRLLKLISTGQVERLVVTHKDRLLRFGAELVFTLCENFGTEVVIINRTEDSSFEEDLAKDVLEIITVFSTRLYGSRSRKNKALMDQLKDVAESLDDD